MAKEQSKFRAIRIDEDLHRDVKTIAVQTERTLRDCADEALRRWLEEQRRQERESG